MATIRNDRDILLQSSGTRILSSGISIIASNTSFSTANNITTPVNITLSLDLGNARPSAVRTWSYALPSAPATWITLGAGTTITITREAFIAAVGTGAYIEYKCYVTETLYEDASATYKINYSSAGAPGNSYALSIIGGTRAIVYDKDGLNPSPAQTAFSASLIENTTAVTPTSYAWSATGVLSGTASTATFTPGTPSNYSAAATSVTLTTTYTNAPSITQTVPIAISKAGSNGAPGTSGTKSITISAFKWSNAGVGTYTQAFTYTWSSGAVSIYPSGWTASASAAPGTGYTLYQINLTITDVAITSTTTTNWSAAVSNTIGYRQDGSIGAQGVSARIAYQVTTSSSPPGAPSGSGYGDSAPAGWSFTATSSLSEGYYMYQSDGLYNAQTNTITWNSPYLSNLKVGSLSAISANLGTITMSTVGSLSSSGKGYGYGDGVFLGYSAGYKMDIGNSSNYLRWTGSSVELVGNISGNSNIDVTGNGRFRGTGGSGWSGLGTVGLIVNDTHAAKFGMIVSSNGVGNQSIYAYCANGSQGILAYSGSSNSTPIVASNASGGNGLEVSGYSVFNGRIVSTVATGTAPFAITSTTLCANLNAQFLSGYQASQFCNGILSDSGFCNTNASGGITFNGGSSGYRFAASGSTVTLQAISDIRLKENILPEEYGLSFINKLNPVSYHMIGKPTRMHGFIAQDVELLIDNDNDSLKLVHDNGVKGVDYLSLIAPLVKSIQELTIELSDVKRQLQELKNGKL